MVCAVLPFPLAIRQVYLDSFNNICTSISGKWKGAPPLPNYTLESIEKRLEGDEKAEFLCFLRRMLCWMPDKRATARELLFDPWLMRGLFK